MTNTCGNGSAFLSTLLRLEIRSRAFSEKFPLIWQQVELKKLFDVATNSTQSKPSHYTLGKFLEGAGV